MESTTRTTKTTTSTSNKTFIALTSETTRILGHSKLRNKATTQTTKSYDYLCNDATHTTICTCLSNFVVNFIHSIHHQFCALHRSPKFCTWLADQFRTFHPSLHESVTPVITRPL